MANLMMKIFLSCRPPLLITVFSAACLALVCCSGHGDRPERAGGVNFVGGRTAATPSIPSRWSDLAINGSLMVPAGKYARKRMAPMRPTYITVHSTYNQVRGADARAHARGLYTGNHTSTHNSLGYLAWHFTVDDGTIYQSLPCNETGEHADYNGPGNRKSIGVEMCENRDGSWSRTMDRTARFVAVMMKEYNIPLEHIVPHYHWRMIRYDDRKDLGHKSCPHLLMDGGKPGRKWAAFKAKIERYRRQLG
jgi:N-acetylmuramoyl-L-alanine amidase